MAEQVQHTEQQQKVVGNYRLIKTLGEGTFGKVKLAQHIITNQTVAVKVLEKDLILQQSDVERISREIKILKMIRHEYLIQLYQIIEIPKQLFLVMEYARSGDLFQEIIDKGELRESQAANYFHETLKGVDYLHSLGIVHRDLKPENLLLDSGKIKIADFGLGNFFKHGETLKTACGSPCYAAPEMVSKLNYVPSKIDIWSLGVVLYAMVCGYLPFEDKNINNLYSKIKKGEFKCPSSLSEDLKDLLKCILNTNPEQRYTIQQILQHRWMVKSLISRNIPSHVSDYSIIVSDNLIQRVSREYKFDREKLKKALNTNKHNAMTTTYYLAVKKYSNSQSHVRSLEVPAEPVLHTSQKQQIIEDIRKQEITAEKPVSPNQEMLLDTVQATGIQPKPVVEAPVMDASAIQTTKPSVLKDEDQEPRQMQVNPVPKEEPQNQNQIQIDSTDQTDKIRDSITNQQQSKNTKSTNCKVNIPKIPMRIKTVEDDQDSSALQSAKKTQILTPTGASTTLTSFKRNSIHGSTKPVSSRILISKKEPTRRKEQVPHTTRELNQSTTAANPRLQKAPRMKIENMKKTATKIYERSASRSTDSISFSMKNNSSTVSIKTGNFSSQGAKIIVKRSQKKPRIINTALIFVGTVDKLKSVLTSSVQELGRNDPLVEYYQMTKQVLYIIRTNVEVEKMVRLVRGNNNLKEVGGSGASKRY